MRRLNILALSVAVLMCAPAATEADTGVHTHGEGVLNLVRQGGTVQIDLELPGMDIVGFEHEPKTHAQKKRVVDAREELKAAERWVLFPKKAECLMKEASVESRFGSEGEKGAPVENHGGFTARYRFDCEEPSQITQVQVRLFRYFSRLKKISATGVTDKGQYRRVLTAKQDVLPLAGK